MVVDLPEPVAPTTSTKPRFAIARSCKTAGKCNSSNVGICVSIRRITAPGNSRWKKALTLKRPFPLTMAKFASCDALNSALRSSSIISCNRANTSCCESFSPCGRISPSTRSNTGAPTVIYKSDALSEVIASR